MGKRGRKPGRNRNYFLEEQENAVVEYLNSDSATDKNAIYDEKLRDPFNKMVESIIRRYKLYIPDETSGETFTETISFLITKLDKFNPQKHSKAYSYYGTICKNHLIGRIQTYTKGLQNTTPYETAAAKFTDSLDYSDYGSGTSTIASDSIEMLIKKIDSMLEDPEKFKLKDSEIIMGKALKNLLENWDYILSTDGSRKLNKSAVLFFLKESTNFDAKGIRDNMKKFKNEFYEIKKYLIG
jgi:hypothetical protein